MDFYYGLKCFYFYIYVCVYSDQSFEKIHFCKMIMVRKFYARDIEPFEKFFCDQEKKSRKLVSLHLDGLSLVVMWRRDFTQNTGDRGTGACETP